MDKVNFFFEDTDFKVLNPIEISNWLEKTISLEGKTMGEINVVFCSDTYLLKMNQHYLNHDTLTDIITFNYVEENQISGDLFISIERVEENAANLKIALEKEVQRVIIHGVLHLIGYNDKSPSEAQEIRAKEDFYLALHSN